jgi:hypothetical protein
VGWGPDVGEAGWVSKRWEGIYSKFWGMCAVRGVAGLWVGCRRLEHPWHGLQCTLGYNLDTFAFFA